MRTLLVVMVQKLFGHAPHFRERPGMVHQQTFLFVRAVISLHVGIFVWPLRGTDIGGNAQADEKTDQRGGKLPSATTADRNHVSRSKVNLGGRPEMRKNARIAILGRLLPKGIVRLSGKQDRGPSVDKMTDFDYLLAFAFPAGIHGNGGGVECASIWTSSSGSRGSKG